MHKSLCGRNGTQNNQRLPDLKRISGVTRWVWYFDHCSFSPAIGVRSLFNRKRAQRRILVNNYTYPILICTQLYVSNRICKVLCTDSQLIPCRCPSETVCPGQSPPSSPVSPDFSKKSLEISHSQTIHFGRALVSKSNAPNCICPHLRSPVGLSLSQQNTFFGRATTLLQASNDWQRRTMWGLFWGMGQVCAFFKAGLYEIWHTVTTN